MFEPGQQVVCVDDKFPAGINDIFNALPRKGLSYIVRDIVPGQDWKCRGTCAVLLRELENKPNAHGIEPGFAVHRFRELTPEEEREQENAAIGMPVHINCRCTITP